MIVDFAHYLNGRRLEQPDPWQAPQDDGFTWIDLFEPDPNEFDGIHQVLGLHELAVEDATSADQRAKLEIYGDSIFIAMKTTLSDAETGGIAFGELQVFVDARSVVVVRHGAASAETDIRTELEGKPEALTAGPMAVLQAVMYQVVAGYVPILDQLGDSIEKIEEALFSDEGIESVEEIYDLIRQVLHFLAATRPLTIPLETLAAGHVPIHGETVYFRDILDNLTRLLDRAETYRELLTTVFQANLAQLSVRLAQAGVQQNEDMRRISAWVAIAATPTVVAGIYGMNFRHMPELGWAFGYPLALGTMALSCLILYGLFRRAKWL